MTERYRVVTEAGLLGLGSKTADIEFYTPEEIDSLMSDFKQRIDVVSRSIDGRIDSLNSRIDTNAAGLKRDLASLVQKTDEIPKLSERINGICKNDIPKLNDALRSYVQSEMLKIKNLPHECKDVLAPFMKSQIDPYFKTFSIEAARLLEQKREFEEQSRKILDDMTAKMQEFENPLQTLAEIKVQKQEFEKQKQEFEQQQQKVFEDVKSLKKKNRILSAAVIVLAVIVCAKMFF